MGEHTPSPSPGHAADPAQIAKLFEETPEWPACVGGTEGTVGGTGSDGPKDVDVDGVLMES
jgi:hypothetical protein